MPSEKVVDKIIELADKLEQVAPHMWEVLVRQHFWFEGVLQAVLGLIVLTAASFSIAKIISRIPWMADVWDDADFSLCLFFILAVVVAIVGLILLGCGTIHCLNPEYYAITDLLGK